MILIEKGAKSCLNWQFICKEKFPNEFSHSNVEEDFDLLFKDQIDHVKLKEIFRSSVRDPNQAVRKFLWKRILFDSNSSQINTIGDGYTQKMSVLFGKNLTIKAELPDFVDPDHLVFYYLNDEGKAAVSRLLNALAIAHPELTFAPLLLPLASLFLHYMNEPETYACLVAVVESKNKITQTDIHWSTTNNVFKRFAQKYSHFAYDYLLEGLYKETKNTDVCFGVVEGWHWWIFENLPFNYVLNIVDSFLLEGQKVLYRFGLALLDNFYRYNNSLNGPHQPSLGVQCMKEFCNKAPVAYDRLIKTAFGYRNMSRKDVDNIFQEEEKNIKKARNQSNQELLNKQAAVAATQQHPDYRRRFFSVIEPFLKGSLIEDGQTQTNQGEQQQTSTNAQSTGNQLSTGERVQSRSSWTNRFKGFKFIPSKKWYLNTSNSSTHSFYHHHHPQSSINLPSFSVENTGSSILVGEQIAQLWRWLPSRYQILELQLIYSTNIHGCRLMTLMDKIEYYTATLIVIQTTTNSIFGAYCSQPWSNRISHDRFKRVRFFGNGESFLFELSPNVDKYEWVGKHVQGQTEPSQELFQYADHDKIIVGGGANNGIGLLINSDLTYGRTDMSDTFANQILGTEKDFEIAILEVFSFNSS